MHRRHVLAFTVVGWLLGGLAAAPTPAAAASGAGSSFLWQGSTVNSQADNHSWTDPRNWSPEGVPGSGDAVGIVSSLLTPCDVHIDGVPQGLSLSNLLLSTGTTKGCHASISGGSLTIVSTMEWTGGMLDTPVTMSRGSSLLIGDEPVHVIERLRQPLTVLDAGLTLASAHLRLQDRGQVLLDQASGVSVTHTSNVKDVRTRDGKPGIVNRGSLSLFDSLALRSVDLRQGGPVTTGEAARLVLDDSRLALDQPLMLSAGSLLGDGTVEGDIVNSGGIFEPTSPVGDSSMTVRGSYQQTSGGRLLLDMRADFEPVKIDGSASVGGSVGYRNAAGYRPAFGDESTVVAVGGTLTWAPACEETLGSGSHVGHWQGAAEQHSVLTAFEKGGSGSCD